MKAAAHDPGPRRFLFLLGSARIGGNTETSARRAAEGLSARDQRQGIHWHFRRSGTGDGTTPPVEGPERIAQDATLVATDIVIAAETFFGLDADRSEAPAILV